MAGAWAALDRLRLRYLARQFARPEGLAGRLLIGPWLDRIGRPMNRLAFEQLRPRPSDRVLEAGFGGGDFLQWMLAATSSEIHGVDPSQAMIARASRRFRREIRDGRLILHSGSAECLPLPDASVDKAVSVNNLYFWTGADAAMREFARVLVPGGLFVLSFQTAESVKAWGGHQHGFRAYEEDEVRALMEGAGFTRIERRSGSDRTLGSFLSLAGVQRTSSR